MTTQASTVPGAAAPSATAVSAKDATPRRSSGSDSSSSLFGLVDHTEILKSFQLTSFHTLTSRVGLTDQRGDDRPAVSHTSHFIDHADLQALAGEIVPARMPDRIRLQCLKCQIKFRPPLVARHHCRCCGDIFCMRCSSTKMRLLLPSPEYTEGDVRVCDYCYTHLAVGDKNSILRYLGVLRSTENFEIVDKLNAARALHMSIEFEPLAQSPSLSAQESYPAFYSATTQFGGFDCLWQIIKSILEDAGSPSELKDLMCRLVTSVLSRIPPGDTDRARPFYAGSSSDGVDLLVKCLPDSDVVESAALALTHAVSRDMGGLQLATFEVSARFCMQYSIGKK